MQSIDAAIRKDNVHLCLGLGWYHMLERNDLETELRRLEEKNRLFLVYADTCIAMTSERIKKIKTFLGNENTKV
jgi:hypothetical protein